MKRIKLSTANPPSLEHLTAAGKKTGAHYASAMLILLLTACGGSSSSPESPTSKVAVVMPPPAGTTNQPGMQLDEPLTFEQFRALNKNAPKLHQPVPAPLTTLPPLLLDTQNREMIRNAYNTLYSQSDNVAMNWTGDYAAGKAGTVSTQYQDATLLRINLIRAMAGVPANVVFDPVYSAKSQQAAFMMSANGQLSHTPPSSWKFYTADGAEAAGNSNLALGNAGPDAISNGYLGDSGSNNAAVGHRRWLLYPQTLAMGSGSVPGSASSSGAGNNSLYSANSLWVFDKNAAAQRPKLRDDFIAWPPKGYVPYPVVYGRWSFSYKDADFSNTRVSISKAGVSIPVNMETQAKGYGENTIVWLLQGTTDGSKASKPASDEAYEVTVSDVRISGALQTFSYKVIVFDPDTATPGIDTAQIIADTSTNVNSPLTFQIKPVADASGYGLKTYRKASLTDTWTVKNAADSWTASTATSYSAFGSNNFILFHGDFGLQTLGYNNKLLIAAGSQVEFDKTTGYATPGEYLRVQVSSNDGATWSDVYSEKGTSSPQASSHIKVDLAKYAGSSVNFRFAVTLDSGASVYTMPGVSGWQFNNIKFANVVQLVDEQTGFINGNQGSTSLVFSKAGDYLAIGRSQYQGRFFSDWGKPYLFTVTSTGFDGNLANYTISKTTGGYAITDKSGNSASQVAPTSARIAFKDVTVAFDVEGKPGQAYRIYQAAFGRVPDLTGLGYWIKEMDKGSNLSSVAASFMQSAEFRTLYGATNPSTDSFLTTLYRNILGRQPDQAGFDYWKTEIQANRITLPGVLASFTESQENKLKTATATQNGIAYIPYLQ
ncbi:DUF4214 domain-containing protein [Undibacterium sp. JH2W]|uniref:DUF4214 domain-containing protein n=1 Tax=Undibacterium sp. JH2W TaxID=3413037 RepID=UPI003BF2D7DF